MSTVVACLLYIVIQWYREKLARKRSAEISKDVIDLRASINTINEALEASPFVTFKPKDNGGLL